MTAGRATAADAGPVEAAWSLLPADRPRFAAALDSALAPLAPYLTPAERTAHRSGRQLRPLLLLLAARLTGRPGPLPGKVVESAAALEMLHVATLIHDDIVDAAPLRRGEPSLAAGRGPEVALLLGDLQFVQAIRVFAASVETPSDMALVRLVLDVGFDICRGELDELAAEPGLPVAELRHTYFRTIDRKTAVLFGLACEAGASLAGARRRPALAMSRYGRAFGRAYQVMDDLLDLVRAAPDSGKEPGADLALRRRSLPILEAAADLGADSVVARVLSGEERGPAALAAARDAVVSSAGFARAYAQARRLAVEAVTHLARLPDGPVRCALEALAYDVVDRGFGPGQQGMEAR